MLLEELSDDDNLLVQVDKSKQARFEDEESDEKDVNKLIVSKSKLRKITVDGPFGGRNRQILDADGKPMTGIEALKESQRLDENGLKLIFEDEAAELLKNDNKKEYVEKVKAIMKKNLKVDEETQKARVKDMRLKKKR